MRKIAYGLIIASLAIPFGATFADDDLEAQCKKDAIEAEVPAAEMEDFMRECMYQPPVVDEEPVQAPPSND